MIRRLLVPLPRVKPAINQTADVLAPPVAEQAAIHLAALRMPSVPIRSFPSRRSASHGNSAETRALSSRRRYRRQRSFENKTRKRIWADVQLLPPRRAHTRRIENHRYSDIGIAVTIPSSGLFRVQKLVSTKC